VPYGEWVGGGGSRLSRRALGVAQGWWGCFLAAKRKLQGLQMQTCAHNCNLGDRFLSTPKHHEHMLYMSSMTEGKDS
jgi:hypothetical protein